MMNQSSLNQHAARREYVHFDIFIPQWNTAYGYTMRNLSKHFNCHIYTVLDKPLSPLARMRAAGLLYVWLKCAVMALRTKGPTFIFAGNTVSLPVCLIGWLRRRKPISFILGQGRPGRLPSPHPHLFTHLSNFVVAKLAYLIVVCDEEQVKYYRSLGSWKTLLIEGGANIPDLFRRDEYVRKTVRTELALKPEEILVIYTGDLNLLDGYDRAINVFKQIASEFPYVKFGFLGAGDTEHGKRILGERLIFSGYVPHDVVSRYFMAADIAFQPMRRPQGGMGSDTIELMSLGVPVVASNINQNYEALFQGGLNVLLIEDRDDASEAAGKLTLLISNPSLRGKLGSAAILASRRYVERASKVLLETLSKYI